MPICVSGRSQVLVSVVTRTCPSATTSISPLTTPNAPTSSTCSVESSNSLRRATNDRRALPPLVPPVTCFSIATETGPRRWIDASSSDASRTARSLTTAVSIPVISWPTQETVTTLPAAILSDRASVRVWALRRATWVSSSSSSESARSSCEIWDLIGSNSSGTVCNSTRNGPTGDRRAHRARHGRRCERTNE